MVTRRTSAKLDVHQARHSRFGRNGTWQHTGSGSGRRLIYTVFVCPACGIGQPLTGYAIAEDGTIATEWHCTLCPNWRGFLKLMDWTPPKRGKLRRTDER